MDNYSNSGKRDSSTWNVQDPDVISLIRNSSSKSLRSRLSLTQSSSQTRWHTSGQSTLPPYDPEHDVEKARELGKKNKHLALCAIFRYSTLLDKMLMFVGTLLALGSGVLIPWIYYWVGKLLLEILLETRCQHKLLLPDPLHLDFHSDISFDFLVNVGYAALALCLCKYLSWRCFAWAADRQVKKISCTYFEWIIRKDMAWFDNYVDREFAQSMTEDITQIRAGIGEKFPALINLISTEICLTVLAFILDYKLALSFLVLAPICLVLAVIGSYADNRQREEAAMAYEKSGEIAEDILCNIKMIKLYQGEVQEGERFTKCLKSVSKNELKWIIFACVCSAAVSCLIFCMLAAAIWFGRSILDLDHGFCILLPAEFASMRRGSHSINLNIVFPEGPQSFVMVFLAIVSICIHAMDIPYFIKALQVARRKAEEVYFLIDWKPRIDNLSEDGKIPKGSAIGRIEVIDVGFKYPRNPKVWAIRNISLTIYPGQIIGLVGHQSSGKSTVLKLLLRLYDCCEGQIIFDGMDIQKYNVRWLRSQVAIFTQEPIIFPATIEENLRYVKPNATTDEIHDACKAAHIHSRIMALSNGYQTMIANHNHENELTNTEIRKLCVARAVLFKPRIFLLDDPLASHDEDIESILSSCIRILHKHSTIIITSSRANAFMKRCDYIYYFQDGTIQEHGTHLQLLRNEGAYYKMIEETLDVVIESKPTFISQLKAFKFAKSLKKQNQRRLQSERVPSNLSSKPIKSDPTVHSFLKVFHRSNNPNKRSQIQKQQRGFGVGGFQTYGVTKAGIFNPSKLDRFRNVFNKNQDRRREGDGTSAKKRSRTLVRAGSKSSKGSLTNGGTGPKDHITVEMTDTYNPVSPPIEFNAEINTAKSKASMQETPEMLIQNMKSIPKSPYNTDWNADNVSICSQDSEEFWDNYSDKLESLKRNTELGSWWDIVRLGGPEWGWISLGCSASIARGVGYPVCGILIGNMIHSLLLSDVAVIHDRFALLSWYFVATGLGIGTAAFFQELFFSIAGRKMCMRLRSLLFASMLKQNLVWYDCTENDISVLGCRLASDTDCLQHVMLTTFGVVFQNTTIFIVSVVLAFMLFRQTYLLTLCLLGAAPVMILIKYFEGRLLYDQISMMDSRLVESSKLSYAVVHSIRSNIILGLERYFLIKYKQCLVKPFRYFYLVSEFRCLCGALARSLPWVIFAVFIYFGFRYTSDPDPTYKEPYFEYLFTVAGLMIFGLINIGESMALLTDVEIGKISVHRILKILESEAQIGTGNNTLAVRMYHKNLLPPKIQLTSIHFKYPESDGPDELRGINMEIEPNSYIAIVGPGKSGKSTLANIILRLIKPTEGKLLFDDENVENVNVLYMRKIMALVEQDPSLIYDMTISENIEFGDHSRQFSNEEVVEAAKAACVHLDILRLEKGYETVVSELESNMHTYALKRRLGLARALIRNPKVLLIDDAASSFDNEHEDIMNEAIQNMKDGRTLIILAHKIRPIRNADMIYVMNDGEIIEYGDDSRLLDLQGLYYKMYTAQRLVEASAELQSNRHSHEMEEMEVIDILRKKALSSKVSRKSTIAYTKFLSEHLQNIQTKLQDKNQAMKEETADAEEIEAHQAQTIEALLLAQSAQSIERERSQHQAASEVRLEPNLIQPKPTPTPSKEISNKTVGEKKQ